MPTVSIITATYNHECYVRECVESVRSQTYTDWEMLVVDDGSSDRTPEIVAAVEDPRVKLLRQENRGIENLAATYNRALSASRGELVAILEGDDVWPKTRLERMVPLFDDPGVVLAYGRAALMTADGRRTGSLIPSPTVEEIFPSHCFRNRPTGSAVEIMGTFGGGVFAFPCATMLRRSALRSVGGFQQATGLPFTDYPTFMKIALEGPFASTNEVTGYWRQHPSSNTQARDKIRTVRSIQAWTERFLRDHEDELPMSESRLREMERSWDLAPGREAYEVGRRALLGSKWADARKAFWIALTRPNRLIHRAGAIAGVLASLCHTDVEFLHRLRHGREADLRFLFGEDRAADREQVF